ncbi:hypothetical protein LTR01_002939 [Friedmanniomyces endolithicus]|nr:hypothetical protein LTR01_002939 [Friedmanniomyces endolithicus]KAK0832257.1 hypothetical protein LTR73_002544 [Friedmanniomyces endolithicus]
MHRAIRWHHIGARRRQYALGTTLGASAVVAYHAWSGPRLLLADSTTEDWSSPPTIVANNQTFSGHAQRLGDAAGRINVLQIAPPRTSKDTSPPFQTEGHSSLDVKVNLLDSPSAWSNVTDSVAAVGATITGFDFASVREKITGAIVPSWVRMLPGYIHKLQDELSMAPWSLSWEIWEEAHNPEINPEITWEANVRISSELCAEEKTFLRNRRRHTAKALARYLGVPESELHPEDVPVIGMCGSGGGLRALVAGAASFLSAAEDGLFDCVTYSAGVSGSCWLQTLYYSSIGQQSHATILDHLKNRIGVHIASPPALLALVGQAPTNKYLLSGLVEKLLGVPDADFGLVDIYGLALAARLLVPNNELRISSYDLKISNQRLYTDAGQQPLPIYTSVRHEIPDSAGKVESMARDARFTTKHFDWFQWFEWTPYEFFCEELDAGIPTWAVGRQWDAGHGKWRENGFALPELRIPLMMGIWGSAFCATLSHYYKEIRPIIKASGLGSLDALLSGKNEELVKVHPVDPAVIPNFALGLRDQLPAACPESIHHATHLQLMDAGMANNLPIYPLLRPGRDVDVIIAFDASADVKGDNWIKVTDGYARQRNIKGWPMGAGWPPSTNTDEATIQELDEASQASAETPPKPAAGTSKYLKPPHKELGYCTVWAGTKEENHEYMDDPPHALIDTAADHHHLAARNAGIAVIYFPFLANNEVPGVDPLKAEFMSTWNFVYTPEEINSVVALARANYREGRERTKRTIRAVWERKRARRWEREEEEREFERRVRVRRGCGDTGYWDNFS